MKKGEELRDQKAVTLLYTAHTLLAVAVVAGLLAINLQTVWYANITVFLGVLAVAFYALEVRHMQRLRQAVIEQSHAQEVLYRDRITTLMNNMTEGIISTDERGVVRVYNAAALNILDTNDSLNGRHIDEVLEVNSEDDDKLQISKIMKKAVRPLVRDDLFYRYSDEEVINLEVTISPVRSDDAHKSKPRQGYILLLRDITKQKSLEEERDEFISVVSHELRTPLTIAEGSLSNIQEMYARNMAQPERVQAAFAAAHEQVIFLSKMVNDLSTLSRAERGVGNEPEYIDVNDMLTSLYTESLPQAKANNLTLDLDISHKIGTIRTSRLYVTELLQNFLTNAIKYTKEGGVVLAAHKSGEEVTIAVRDTGIGISKADQKKIYEKFYRSEDYRTRETRGTGLGLYVSTKLARKIGTQIQLKSRLNHGSEFSITLKLTKQPNEK